MPITISEALNLDRLKNFKLIAGASGLKNRITKIGILDYEFTKQGASQWADGQFIAGEFLLTTFLYARDNELLITEAVKKLAKNRNSGIAIKNIFSFNISSEVIEYANIKGLPIFLFTDNSVFFEDLIIDVTNAIVVADDYAASEKRISSILNENLSKAAIKKTALEINHLFKNQFFIIYLGRKEAFEAHKTIGLLHSIRNKQANNNNSSIIKYMDGFFYVATFEYIDVIDLNSIVKKQLNELGIDVSEYWVGISNPQYHLTEFKKCLQESLYASQISQTTNTNISYYKDIGVFKLILPFIEEQQVTDFCMNIVDALIEYDIYNKSVMLETAKKYVECGGNIKETAKQLFNHENTIRYRINKIGEIIKLDLNKKSAYEELSLALKIHLVLSSMKA